MKRLARILFNAAATLSLLLLVAILVLGAAYARWRRDLPRRAALDEGWEVPEAPDPGVPDEPTRLDPGQPEP